MWVDVVVMDVAGVVIVYWLFDTIMGLIDL